ncbi:regulatory protein, Fis family [Polaromonas sp. OV174]|uniref:TnsD family Tn7-like transposition protein n=1 Tax=Polaromonas sp. OV174 TaxID=1855300 RepID=UPI0008F35059|nr:TnsD family Tn7-like transposition protein [Polaromonas sp. OV174]SFC21654.1 regulatory protein, Fis family [Polaromonas sp. OV174]
MKKLSPVAHRRLDFFPTPVPDESVTSVLSRYVARSPGGARNVLRSLGLPNLRPDNPMPPIAPFLSLLPLGHPWVSVRDVLATHTIVPSLLFFTATDAREKVLSKLAVAARNDPFLMLGLALRKDFSAMRMGLKYCPDCVRDSLAKNGFGCYLRHHQLPYVLVCEIHERPLVAGCKVCGHGDPQKGAWHMASRCDCQQPTPYLTVPEGGVPDDCLQSLVWIAKQSGTTMRASTPPANPVIALRERLRATGFGGARSGLSVKLLSDGLRSRFGTTALKLLGAADSDEELLRWTSRILGINNGSTIKDVGRLLCLTGLCCSSVSNLETELDSGSHSALVKQAEPKGYSAPPLLRRESTSAEVVRRTLEESRHRISRAAARLGVSPATLATDAVRHGIRVPLQASLCAKLGASKLDQIRQRLRAGVPKKTIEMDLNISDWTRRLIELDDLSLIDQHRQSTVDSLRKRHRSAIEAFMAVNRDAGRWDVAQQFAGPYDWLYTFDGVWLSETVQRKPLPSQRSTRAIRGDWPAIDQNLSIRAEDFVAGCRASDVRPQRITKYRILKGIGFLQMLTADKVARLPQLVETLDRLVDSDDSYIERRLQWAMAGYRRTGHELSMNRFRRLIAWGAPTVSAHRDRIMKLAVELGVPVDVRSLFA